MRDYNVHFLFYSEEWGKFDDMSYPVMADTPFEARVKAWDVCDQDKDTIFCSNIKQFAVTWKPNLLDAGDYFYSHAADIKQNIGYLINVEIPNDNITNSGQLQRYESERCSNLNALYTLDMVAKDLYADKGMIPPSIYEELYYAEKLHKHLSWGEKADALWERIDKAKKWDQGSIYMIRDLIINAYTTLCGEVEHFHEHFDRNGIYPVQNKLDERDYEYISRWQNKRVIDRIVRIPFLKESDIIMNSADHMDYACQTLLINYKMLSAEYQTPENQFWQLVESSEHDKEYGDYMLSVENPITGLRMSCGKNYFLGVLRPDIAANIDFNALKKLYITCSLNLAGIKDMDDYYTGMEEENNEFER